MSCRALFTLILTAILVRAGFAQSVIELNPIKDNTLYEDATGSLSNGAGAHFFAGKNGSSQIRRGLLAFNVADSIPAGATIESVVLRLHMSRTSGGTRIVELHRVLSDWGEGASHAIGGGGGEGGGGPAMTGDATWIHTFFDTTFWANPGGDFSTMASASLIVDDIAFYTWGSTAQMVADVQDWLDNPTTNFGWVTLGDESGSTTTKRFDSRDDTLAINRPLLIVAYTGPTSVVGSPEDFPLGFQLSQNFPNPFNPTTNIRFRLPSEQGFVSVKVYDVLGRVVATLVNEEKAPGTYQVVWDASGQASGVYLYELQAGDFSQTKKLVLLR